MSTSFQAVAEFLRGWKPFTELPAGLALPGQILAFFSSDDPEERREHFSSASDLYRLHDLYRRMDLFRDGKNKKAEQFEALFALPTAELAEAIEQKRQKDLLDLIQFCFEFGRHEVAPRHNLMREFIYHLLCMDINGPGMKYSAYAGGTLYTGSGKTHDEMAQDFVRLGLGAGRPMMGGQFYRQGTYEFTYDAGSTAFRSGDPAMVREGLLKWSRITGGREDKLIVRMNDPSRLG